MKNALSFLKKIKKNNNTPWMHAHKDEYQLAKREFEFLVQELIVRIREWDERLPDLEPKDCVFRFNRDTRFSENKNPYKENFGAYFAYGGKKGHLPGYYLHVSPKEVFVAGGVWMPEPDKLLRLRRYLLNHGDELRKILGEKKFKKAFPGLDTEQTLTRAPKGFPADHPQVEFMKLKSFTVSAPVGLPEVTKPGFGKLVDKSFQLIRPFNHFLARALSESD